MLIIQISENICMKFKFKFQVLYVFQIFKYWIFLSSLYIKYSVGRIASMDENKIHNK